MLDKHIKPGSKVFRHLKIEKKAIDEEARTVALAFSSEEPYERYWGIEVLDHESKSIRLGRLSDGGPLLMDHDSRDHVGVIESVEIGADKVGRAVVRFGRSQRAEEIFNDVVDGIRSHVSVGYIIHKDVREESDGDVDTYRVTDWEPFEVSMVSVPADTSVGIGRSSESAADANSTIDFIEIKPAKQKKEKSNNKKIEVRGAEMSDKKDDNKIDAAAVERQRTSDLLATGEQYKKYGGNEMARSFIRDGKSVDAMKEALLEKAATQPTPSAEIGLDKKSARQFSFLRAMNALAHPNDKRALDAAAFEFECSRAVETVQGRTAQGILIPNEVLTRELTVGAGTANNLVDTDLRGGDFIDMLRNAMVLSGLGVRTLAGLVGDMAIPRQTGGATSYWLGESGAPTESDQTLDQIAMTPHTVGAFTDISRKTLKQSSIDVENLVQGDLAQVLGLAIEQAAINGAASGDDPTGLLNTTGIGSVAGGANGAAPTDNHIIDLESAVSVANAAIGQMAYLVNATTRGKLKKTLIDAGSGEKVWDRKSPDSPLNGYVAAMTNAVPSNGSKGSGVNLSSIVFGNFNDMLIGMWGALDLTVDPYSKSTSGAVRIVALQDVDVAIRHAESFASMTDAITT